MKRNVIVGVLAAAALVVLLLLSTREPKPGSGGATQVVVTTGGQVTVVPAEDHFKATIIAPLPKTNTASSPTNPGKK
jgi:hypothetical protein